MTVSERWQAWEKASPAERDAILAWLIGNHGDAFDQAAEFATARKAVAP